MTNINERNKHKEIRKNLSLQGSQESAKDPEGQLGNKYAMIVISFMIDWCKDVWSPF